MSNYSDEENPWSTDKWLYRKYFIGWRAGYQYAEKDPAFTKLERSCFLDLLQPENSGQYLWSPDRIDAMKSLRKKVLGE